MLQFYEDALRCRLKLIVVKMLPIQMSELAETAQRAYLLCRFLERLGLLLWLCFFDVLRIQLKESKA